MPSNSESRGRCVRPVMAVALIFMFVASAIETGKAAAGLPRMSMREISGQNQAAISVHADSSSSRNNIIHQAIEHGNALDRVHGAAMLWRYEASDFARTVLLEGLTHPDSEVRVAAVLEIQDARPVIDEAVPLLIVAFHDKNGRVASAAIQAATSILRMMKPTTELSRQFEAALFMALKHPRAEARMATMGALESLKKADTPEFLEAVFASLEGAHQGARLHAIAAIGRMQLAPTQAIGSLVLALEDPDQEIRRKAAFVLGARFGAHTEIVVPVLLKASGDKDIGVRTQAAEVIAQVEPPSAAVDALLQIIKSRHPEVRDVAVDGLRYVGIADERVVEALVQALSDQELWIRPHAAEALGYIKPASEAAIAALRRVARDGRVEERHAALLGLEKLGPSAQSAYPELMRSLVDSSRHIRHAAVGAILATQPKNMALARDMLPLLDGNEADQRQVAAKVLAGIGPAAATVVPVLEKALDDSDDGVRVAVADALSRISPSPATLVLPNIMGLRDSDRWVRFRAAKDIQQRVWPEESIPYLLTALIAALDDPDTEIRQEVIRAIGRFGSAAAPATDIIAQVLNDPVWEVRWGAAWTLGRIGPAARTAEPELRQTLQDPNENVRQAATYALRAIFPVE